MPSPIHLLTAPGQLAASRVVCGAWGAALATLDVGQVTCPACLRQCTCGPTVRLCPACSAYNAQHRSQPTTLPERKAGRPSYPYRSGIGPRPRRRRARHD